MISKNEIEARIWCQLLSAEENELIDRFIDKAGKHYAETFPPNLPFSRLHIIAKPEKDIIKFCVERVRIGRCLIAHSQMLKQSRFQKIQICIEVDLPGPIVWELLI